MATALPKHSGGASGAGTLKGRPFVPGQRDPEGLTVCPAHFNYLAGTPRGGALPSPWDEPSSRAVSSLNVQVWSPRFETVLGAFPSRLSFCGSFTLMIGPRQTVDSCPEARPCVLAGGPRPCMVDGRLVPVCWPVQGQPRSLAPQPAPEHLCVLSPSALEGHVPLPRQPHSQQLPLLPGLCAAREEGLSRRRGKLQLGHLCP